MSDEFVTQMVPVSELVVEEGFNARKNLGDIEAFANTLLAEGVHEPIGVKKIKGKSGFKVIYGFRRVAAAQKAEIAGLPARIYPATMTVLEQYKANMIENVARESLNPMDEAEGIQRLIAGGVSEEDVARSLGFSKTLITQRLQLLKISGVLQDRLRAGQISVAQARAIEALPEDRHERFADVAASLPIDKLKGMVDKEMEKILNANAPTPAAAPEPAAPEPAPAPVGDGDPVLLATSVTTCLSDMLAATYKNDQEKATKAVITLRSIDWTKLSVQDLDALCVLLEDVAEDTGCIGASDNIASIGGDEAAEEPEPA